MANIKDQENTTGGVGIGYGDLGNGRDYMVQGFKSSSAVTNITHVSIKMNATGSKDLKIWIDTANANSEPDNGVGGIGGVTLIANADLSTSLKKFELTTPVNLTAGQQYIICTAPWDISGDAWAADFRDWDGAVSNPYANGRRNHGNTAYGAWSAPDSGNADIVFETWGDEPVAATKTFTIDGLVKEIKTKTFTIDGVVKGLIGANYILNGTNIPRPKHFFRRHKYMKTDSIYLDGTTKRDITSRKEVYVLTWENLSKSHVDLLNSIVELNTSVTFQINETNLVISSTNVLTAILEKEYNTKGSDYLSKYVLELTEVT